MKFTINRRLMYEAVKTVLKIIRKNKENPEISGILIEADADSGILTLTGTDIQTHIQRRLREEHIEESGNMILTPLLAEMLRLLNGDNVTFQSDTRMVSLYSGAARYTIPFLEAKSFPKLRIPFPEDTIQIKGINSLIKRTVFATDGNITDYTKSSLSYVKLSFDGGITRAEATNGSCIAIATSPHCADGKLEMILHEKALRILSDIIKPSEELYIGIVGKYAIFLKEDMIFSTMTFTGRYLDASKLLENFIPKYSATVDARKLLIHIDNVSSIFDTNDDKSIHFQIKTDKVFIQAKTVTSSSSSDVNAAETTPTPTEGFYYHPSLFTECLQHMTGPIKVKIDQRGFAMMEARGCRYFICPRKPVHIREQKPEDKQKSKAKTTATKAA